MTYNLSGIAFSPADYLFGIARHMVSAQNNKRAILSGNVLEGNTKNVASRNQHGFTLIELLTVVAIAGILASIALPSYTNYVTRGKIPNATANLSAKRIQMEQFFQDNHTYVGAPACANDTTTSLYFTFACSVAATATTYTLQATGGNGKNQTMDGFIYTINESNAKTSSIVAPAKAGWIASSTSCWITSTGGAC